MFTKNKNTKQESIFIKNPEENNMLYQSPESANLYGLFYIALEKLGICR